MKQETREIIQAIIKEHGYVPNPVAQALSTGQSKSIGMFLPSLTNTVFAQMAEGCQSELLKHNLNLMIIPTKNYSLQTPNILLQMDQRQVQGYIISGGDFVKETFRNYLEELLVPAIIVEKLPFIINSSSIYIDDEQGTRDALDYFISRKHKNIALISGEPQYITAQRRLNAVTEHLAGKAIRLTVENAHFDNLESGRLALNHLMQIEPRPTALLCMNDILALGAIKECSDLGIKIPEELEVIGFDNIPMASFSTPTLSTIHASNTQVGIAAAKMLLNQINNPQTPISHKTLPVRLIHRGSTRHPISRTIR